MHHLTLSFLRGETSRLIELPLEVFEKAGRPELLVGALVLTGDFERAQVLAQIYEPKDQSGVIGFYLSLGFSRAGRYSQALEHIERLERMQSQGGLIPFFVQQSRGFYSFNIGDIEQATKCARAALACAELSREAMQPLAQVLSLDLLGHSLVRSGFNRRGIKTLRLAREAATRVHHADYVQAISISLLKYESISGFEPTRTVSRLYRALVELKPKDSYSRSELRLELARQLILRGQLREARRYLEDAAADILGSQNSLQTSALHLRLAWMARLEGRPTDALLGLQSAEIGLSLGAVGADSRSELLMKIAYFRLDLFRQIGRTREAQELEAKLRQMQASEVFAGTELRLFKRRSDSAIDSPSGSSSEDPFGDLMDRVSANAPGVELELLNGGYFGLLLPLLGLQFGQSVIVLSAPGGRVIAVDNSEARIVENGLKGLLGKLLSHLAEGPCTKREAIEMVWGYEYEAERHDRLLAVAISRIRKALGGQLLWLELQGDRIVLRDHVTVRFWTAEISVRPPSRVPSHSAPLSTSLRPSSFRADRLKQGFRIRQLQVLDDLATRGDVGVQDLVQRFGISRASALRDLNELVQAGFLLRTGETRATRYMRAEKL